MARGQGQGITVIGSPVQDTIPICPTQLSQLVAEVALQEGREWVTERVRTLTHNRQLALDALSVLGEGAVAATEGAIYFFAQLPDGLDDEVVVERLIKEHCVTLIGGSSCGMPGYIRVAYANCSVKDCEEACRRLKIGLETILAEPRQRES
jgi:aspartate/methionine/tyrosine aminotransferase